MNVDGFAVGVAPFGGHLHFALGGEHVAEFFDETVGSEVRSAVTFHAAVAKIGVGDGHAVEGGAWETLPVDGHHLSVGFARHGIGLRERAVAGKGDDVIAVNLLELGQTYCSTRTPLA